MYHAYIQCFPSSKINDGRRGDLTAILYPT